MLRRGLIGSLVLALLPAVGVAAAPTATVRGPAPYGVVHPGQRLQVDLAGACGGATTRVRVQLATRAVEGRPGRGCHPVVTVPSEAAVRRAGFVDGAPISIELRTGSVRVPLTYWRAQPSKPAAGAPVPVRTVDDPRERQVAMQMRAGDVVDLGRADLTGLQSVDVRNLTAGTGVWELRVGSPTGTAIARGQLGEPGSVASAGDKGWYHSVAPLQLRPLEDVIGDANTFADLTPVTGQAARLFLAVVAVVDAAPTWVNYVDLNGPGIGLPHRFSSERGFSTLFDGSTFDGWRHVGPGRFVLREGAMRAEHDPQDRGWAWLWWSREQFSDVVVRLRFKVETWEDNGGVLLRHVDPLGDPNRSTASADEVQVQEGFENLTGGIAHEADAYRLATGMVGQWNDLEVVARGRLYVVRINGTEVQRFTSRKATRGFIAVENEQLVGTKGGHIWYDDVRVHRCEPADALCAP